MEYHYIGSASIITTFNLAVQLNLLTFAPSKNSYHFLVLEGLTTG